MTRYQWRHKQCTTIESKRSHSDTHKQRSFFNLLTFASSSKSSNKCNIESSTSFIVWSQWNLSKPFRKPTLHAYGTFWVSYLPMHSGDTLQAASINLWRCQLVWVSRRSAQDCSSSIHCCIYQRNREINVHLHALICDSVHPHFGLAM